MENELKKEIDELTREILKLKKNKKNNVMYNFYLNNIKSFIYNNAVNSEERILLLTVLKKTYKFYEDKIIKYCEDFFYKDIEEFKEEGYAIIKRKIDLDCSSNHLINHLYRLGIKENIITITNDKIDNVYSDFKHLIYLDDFIGSGNQLKKTLKIIEENFSDKKVHIFAFLWMKEGIDNFNSFRKKNNNNIYCLGSKHKILKDYTNLFDEETMQMISKICDECEDAEYKYGYKNSGSLVLINDISPNNNLSIMWRTDIKHQNSIWYPYALYDVNRKSFQDSLITYMKNSKFIFQQITKLKSNDININKNQLKLILYCMNLRFSSKEEIQKELGYVSINQLNSDIDIIQNKIMDINKMPHIFYEKKTYELFYTINELLYENVKVNIKNKSDKFGKYI